MNQAQDWFNLAEEDRRIAELALLEQLYNQVCFHAQQGVEKLLKGFLKSGSRGIPRTHSLVEILSHCVAVDGKLQDIRDDCEKLQAYYIVTRYPDALPGSLPEGLPTRQDAVEALDALTRMAKMIKSKAKKRGE